MDPELILRLIVYFLIFCCSYFFLSKLILTPHGYFILFMKIPAPLWSENLDYESHIKKLAFLIYFHTSLPELKKLRCMKNNIT